MRQAKKTGLARIQSAGLSIAELLIALALMGFVSLAIANFLIKGNAASASMSTRIKEGMEVQAVILDIMQDLAQGAYISTNSHKQRLEYTTYDSSGVAIKKIYQIALINSKYYLQLSTDNGTTWGSPYRVSPYDKYILAGSTVTGGSMPYFLFAHDANNCTQFRDAGGISDIYEAGIDDTPTYVNCGTHSTSSPLLNRQSQATKVILKGFTFYSSTGNPLVSRALPNNIFMSVAPAPVASPTAAASGAKDSPLLYSFDVATANSLFGTGFDVRGLTWDPIRGRLLIVGHHNTGSCKIYQADRNGVLIGPGKSILDTSVQLAGIALLDDGQTVIALDDSAKKVYWYNLNNPTPLVPIQTLNLANPSTGTPTLAGASNLVNTPTSIAYDPNTPTDFYVVGTDPADSGLKIFAINATTGSLSTASLASGKVSLPAGIDASNPPGGLAIEPVTGDFLVVRNAVSGSSPNKLITVYRVTRAGASSSFTVNVDDIGSTATGTAGYWGLGYSPETNHIFLSDTVTDKVYEVFPSVLISPRS